MAKTNITTSVGYSLATLSIFLAVGVIIAGAHLKDVVSHANAAASNLGNETSKKVSGELHNHIEKQSLKSLTKAVGDDIARTDRKHTKKVQSRLKPVPKTLRRLVVRQMLSIRARQVLV